jgi:hypothetical protein
MNFAEQFDQFKRMSKIKSATMAVERFYIAPIVFGYEPKGDTQKIHFTFPDGSRWEGEEEIKQCNPW